MCDAHERASVRARGRDHTLGDILKCPGGYPLVQRSSYGRGPSLPGLELRFLGAELGQPASLPVLVEQARSVPWDREGL